MYLRPFLLIQILAFLTTEIWALFRLRGFGLQFLVKLEALANAGYVPVPFPHEMSTYLHVGSLLKAATFFTFTLGFTLGLVAFSGALLLNRLRISASLRLGWTVAVSAILSFLLGFSSLAFLMFAFFFGLAHLAISVSDAPFHKFAVLALVPLLLILVVFRGLGFIPVRDTLLQNTWGEKVVAFYYWYSPFPAELITPLAQRTQVTIWTDPPVSKAEELRLLEEGIYTVSTRAGADVARPDDARTGHAPLEAVRTEAPGGEGERLRKATYYSIYVSVPLAVMLLCVLAADRVLSRFRYAWIVILVCTAFFSALLVYHDQSQNTLKSKDILRNRRVEDIRRWTMQAKRTDDPELRESLRALLRKDNPALRLWAANALAYLPSLENLEILKRTAQQDPNAIVRCKAVFALSHHNDAGMIPFLESRLKGEEDWYVKHYLLRALRRLGWIG